MKGKTVLGLFCTLLFAAGCNEPTQHTGYRAEPGYSGDVISSPANRGTTSSTYPSSTRPTPTYPSSTYPSSTYPSYPSSTPPSSTYPTATYPTYPSSTTSTYPTATYPSTTPSSADRAAAVAQADTALASSVRQQIDRYGELAAASANVQITSRSGAVTLSGTVPSQRERGMIDALVRNTTGVTSVNNQIQVSASPGVNTVSRPVTPTSGQTDQAIANQLQQSLASHPTIGGFAQNIRANVQSGRVTLSGNVPSEQDRHLVDEVVRNIPGVVSVTDQLQISALPTGRTDQTTRVYPSGSGVSGSGVESFNLHVQSLSDADRAVAQRILEDLRADPSMAGNYPPISINVSNGKVTLQGTVSSFDEKRRIAEAMQRIAGVNNLYDELQVGGTGP